MVSEARKRANKKWSKENLTVVGCKVTREKAARFKESCAALGVVPYQILLRAVDNTIAEAGIQSDNEKRAGE